MSINGHSGEDHTGPDDPFKWSNERLIKELCTEERTWTAPAPRKWPDPVRFASVLEEHDLDGQDLLTHEDEMGREAFDTLCKDLEIKKIPHKTSLRVAIRLFQERSPAYKAWKKERAVKNVNDFQTPQKPQPSSPKHSVTPPPFRLPDINNQRTLPDRTSPAKTFAAQPQQAGTQLDNTPKPAHVPRTPSPSADLPSAMGVDVDAAHPFPDPSKKRKRLAPTNVSSTTRSHSGHLINHDEEGITAITYNPLLDTISDRPWQKSREGAYLGHWKLTMEDILQGSDPFEPGSINDNDGLSPVEGFGWAKPARIPAGRRVQVDTILRRFLRPKRASLPNLGRYKSENTSGSGVVVGAVVGSGGSGSALLTSTGVEDLDDQVLPALGESDDEGYDTETWEAMEQEELERQNQKQKKQQHLPRDVVDRTIADAIRNIEAKWTSKKLTKLRKKEYQLWEAARRSGSLRFKTDMARREAERFSQRISKLVDEIAQVEWKNEAEIRRQVSVLEASIEDKQLAQWEARLYSLPSAPAKAAVARPLHPRNWSAMRSVRTRAIEGDEEILTSSSEEDDPEDAPMADFIVDDQPTGSVSATGPRDGHKAVSSDSDGDDDDIIDDGLSSMRRPHPVSRSAGKASNRTPARSPDTANSPAPAPVVPHSVPLHAENIPAIVALGAAHYEMLGHVTYLLLTLFYDASQEQMMRLFDNLSLDDGAIWQKYCLPALNRDPSDQPDQPMVDEDEPMPEEKPEDDGTLFTRFFYIFLFCGIVSPNDFDPTKEETKKDILSNRGRLGSFCVKMRMLAPYIGYEAKKDKGKGKEVVSGRSGGGLRTGFGAGAFVDSEDEFEAEPKVEFKPGFESEPDSPAVETIQIDSDGHDESMDEALVEQDEQVSPSKRRKRPVRRDKGAQDLRDKDKARHENLETRRKALYQNLEQSGTISRDQARLIINLAKDDHHGFVYINSWISRNIRDHQIEGVRFMWNQIVTPSDSRQGCLLAHTMGLGKTMQVITLLVAIAEAAMSSERSISSQIPDDLRQSTTLILCPSGLVENWLDELLAWARDGILGETFHVAATMDHQTRYDTVQAWAERGGTMVLGYPMFARLLDDFDDLAELLQETPNIVVADEAHALKNPKSKVHRITSSFRTSARIAMTGSPLANSVNEYHSMINWVAPNYLADHREFASVYANPIKEGFYRDSTAAQKRRAYKMLKILKDTVAPKIHRATVATLKGELPDKREFILYLPLTDLQLKVYEAFMEVLRHHSSFEDISTTIQLWNFMVNVTLLLAHPMVLKTRLDEMQQTHADAREARKGRDAKARKSSLPEPVVRRLLQSLKEAASAATGTAIRTGAELTQSLNNIAYSSKMTVLCGILDEARRIGEKVLVFSQSRNVLDYLETEFRRQRRRFSRLDGDTAVGKRQAMVKEFNAGSDEVYLISTTAGGVGLNIQGANRVVIFDFRWNPMHEQQAIGRAFRIGQQKNVFVYWLIVDGTYETLLHDQAVFKTQLASRVVDKKNPSAWADQMRNYAKDPVMVPINPHLQSDFRGRDGVLDALLAGGSASKNRIARIVSTDTFEQEEPEAMLTAEELSEAATMVIMNKRRHKYGGQLGAMAVAAAGDAEVAEAIAAALGHGASGSVGRMQVDGASFAPSAFTAAAAGHARPPMSLGTTYQHPSQYSMHDIPTYNQPFTPVPSQLPASRVVPSTPLPMQIPTQATTTNVTSGLRREHPIHVPSVPSVPSTVPSTPTVPSSRPGPKPKSAFSLASSGLMASDSDLRDEITKRLASGAVTTQKKPSMQIAACIADVVVDNIKRFFRLSGLPASSQWARLKKRVSTDAVFLEAVVYGIVLPIQLATMTHAQENPLVASVHDAMDELDAFLAGKPSTFRNTLVDSPSRELFGSSEVLRIVLTMKLLEGTAPSFRSYQGDVLRSHDKALSAINRLGRVFPLTLSHQLGPPDYFYSRLVRLALRDGAVADYLLVNDMALDRWLMADTPEREAALIADMHLATPPGDGPRIVPENIIRASKPSQPGPVKIPHAPDSHPRPQQPHQHPHHVQQPEKAEPRDSRGSIRDIPAASGSAGRHIPGGPDGRPLYQDIGPSIPVAMQEPVLSTISNGFQDARKQFQQEQRRSSSQSAGAGSSPAPTRDQLAMSEVIRRRQRKEGRMGGPSGPGTPTQSPVQGRVPSHGHGSPSLGQGQQTPHKTKKQIAREMLEADERQKMQRLRRQQGIPSGQPGQQLGHQHGQHPGQPHGHGATKKPRILPPPNPSQGSTAHDPFVLD